MLPLVTITNQHCRKGSIHCDKRREKKGGEMDVEVRKYEIKHDLQKT